MNTDKKKVSIVKSIIAGFFMGLANLVPGVSGGTMILALGLYEDFIESFSDLTRFKFSIKAFKLIGILFGMSFLTIFALSGIIQFLMESYLSEMLSLFIGLTLGGVPILYKRVRPLNLTVSFWTLIGFTIMAVVAFVLKPGGGTTSIYLFFIGGFIGSAAMILPGISGSYLLLVMGLYLPVISSINDFKYALTERNLDSVISTSLEVLIPFAFGLVAGIVVLSNLLKFLLAKKPIATESLLLGILLGSVLGLYPYKALDLSKLCRYAVSKEVETARELRVMAFGWSSFNNKKIFNSLKKIEQYDLSFKIISEASKSMPKISDIESARLNKAVILSYDQRVERAIRDNAKDKSKGKVPLIIIPNTNFSVLRLLGGLALLMVGLITTLFLGRQRE